MPRIYTETELQVILPAFKQACLARVPGQAKTEYYCADADVLADCLATWGHRLRPDENNPQVCCQIAMAQLVVLAGCRNEQREVDLSHLNTHRWLYIIFTELAKAGT